MIGRTTSPRAGFTLIELLVVLGIIGLLLGITIPAVQGAREAARRAQCANNLKQIGLALHNYHDAHRSLPPGHFQTYDPRIWGDNPPCSAQAGDKSFFVMILPQLEQSGLYNSINQSTSIYSRENRTCFAVTTSVLACPGDGDARVRPIDTSQLVPLGFAGSTELVNGSFTSYVGSFGSVPTGAFPNTSNGCRTDARALAQTDGCLNDIGGLTLGSIIDGTGQTVLVSERATTYLRDEQGPDPRVGWYFSNSAGDTLFFAMQPPNYRGDAVARSASGASSTHPGGVNALMADGSVRFITDTINSWSIDPDGVEGPAPRGATMQREGWWKDLPRRGVWQALATRNGGEILDANSY